MSKCLALRLVLGITVPGHTLVPVLALSAWYYSARPNLSA